jgi:hypothetical protein
MRITRPWLVGVATIGIAATLMAAVLLWLLFTQPVAVVEALGRGL